MAKVLIIYSTTDGHTRKICCYVMRVLQQRGNDVTLVSIDEEISAALDTHDKIVIGASIRYGKHGKQVYHFIEEHQRQLEKKSNAFFSVNLVARKPEKCQPDTNPYLKKFLRQISWSPQKLAVFAGKIDYQRYNSFDRFVIRLIMWITKGPTDPKANIEFTDWSKVNEFAHTICEM